MTEQAASETPPSGVSRRGLLGVSAGAAMAGVAVGFGGAYATRASAASAAEPSPATAPASLDAPVPFRGVHQAGIVTRAQDRMHFVALDVVTKDRALLVDLLKKWTQAAERMTAGAEPPRAAW